MFDLVNPMSTPRVYVGLLFEGILMYTGGGE